VLFGLGKTLCFDASMQVVMYCVYCRRRGRRTQQSDDDSGQPDHSSNAGAHKTLPESE